MSSSIIISGTRYTVKGTVTNEHAHEGEEKGVLDLHVSVYDKDFLNKDDYLGIGVTDATGAFSVSFDASQFKNFIDRKPDLYFIVEDGGLELLNTKDDVIKDADESTPPINLEVSILNDQLREEISKEPAPGWVGGFAKDFPYPNPTIEFDRHDITIMGNMENIDKLDRQQKVLWPEFSWESAPGETDPKRCYQMFAPDISRLGYTNDGRVYSIICPQQGFSSPSLGNINVEVTVTGCRGWANEDNRELAADMGVVGKIWFSPSAHENKLVQLLLSHFNKEGLPFPGNKENAIVIETFNPNIPGEHYFPLTKGPSTGFPIPNFAQHPGISWTMGHLGVRIGSIIKKNNEKVDKFNQLILDIFNIASGNMLKKDNILTWNVWFTAPQLVDRDEWQDHADKWRESIDADHGSPDGPSAIARHFDGSPFKPLNELLKEEMGHILSFIKDHF